MPPLSDADNKMQRAWYTSKLCSIGKWKWELKVFQVEEERYWDLEQ